MVSLVLSNKAYDVDEDDFLESPYDWDENFAEGMASHIGVSGELTPSHWRVINFIRTAFDETGNCPSIYGTCRANGLHLHDLRKLFPMGYLRGACKLAGLSYMAECIHPSWLKRKGLEKAPERLEKRVYRINAWGFLMDPSEWDEDFAVCSSIVLKMPEGLTDKHWKIIRFLRNRFQETGSIPTVYETCADNQIQIEELEQLFPDGYHRGAVKIAGLRLI
jgi:tRNA 2-thiouridine synthesizing protein E